MIKHYALATLFIIFGLSVLAQQAAAQEAATGNTSAAGDVPILEVSFTPPTTRVNGSPLDPSDIAGYTMSCQHESLNAASEWEFSGDVSESDMPMRIDKEALSPDFGTYTCVLTVAASGDYDGLKYSTPSNSITYDWNAPVMAMEPPEAPANFQILTQ